MLQITQSADGVLRATLGGAGIGAVGLRLSPRTLVRAAPAAPCFELDLVLHPLVDDELVVSPGGIRVYLDPAWATFLETRVLDGDLDDQGTGRLVLKTTV